MSRVLVAMVVALVVMIAGVLALERVGVFVRNDAQSARPDRWVMDRPMTIRPSKTDSPPLVIQCPGHGQMALVVKDSEDNVIFSIGCS